MKFSILKKELKAISRFAATKDLRYYLVGVHIVQNARGTYLEATNGHMMGRLLVMNEPMPEASIILPLDAVKTLCGTAKNGDGGWLHFETEGVKISVIDGLNTYTFQAVEGTFPDCDRVVPLVLKKEDESPSGYNPEYLMAFQQAANDIKGTRKGASPTISLIQRGNSSGIVNIGVDNFIGIIMPMRDGIGASVPEWCYRSKTKPVEAENYEPVTE
jgi:hypothetical protein